MSSDLSPLTTGTLHGTDMIHGFFTRRGGVSAGIYDSLNCGPGSADDPAHIAENRTRVAQHLGIEPDRLLTLYQVHSSRAVTADAPWTGDAPKADGIATATPGLAIGILTADCAPVLFADPEARVIGAAHAGWKGATSGILEATLDAMEKLGAARSRIAAAVGPAIAPASYEVKKDFIKAVSAADAEAGKFVISRDDGFRFDLPGYVKARLEGLGLAAVESSSLDTYADPERFFSYRRCVHAGKSDYGRQISAIALL